MIIKKIAILGAIANPNIGDEAILEANIQLIYRMYGKHCLLYIFTKNSSYTSLYSNLEKNINIVPVSYLHDISVQVNYSPDKIDEVGEKLLKNYCGEQRFNIIFESLKKIFMDIDIFHIIGGGYLNSYWPDMIHETLLATKLAKKYSKPYIMTGISAYPLNDIDKKIFLDICKNANFVDFRDNTLKEFVMQNSEKYQVSVDDAIALKVGKDYCNFDNNYFNILIHDWEKYSDCIANQIRQVFIPFIHEYLDNHTTDYVNILAFSSNDFKLWDDAIDLLLNKHRNKIKFVDCTTRNCVYAKSIISNAKFNIGTRFHMAIFSLAVCVPVFSIFYDDYYKKKIISAHSPFKSGEYVNINDLKKVDLENFSNNIDGIKNNIKKNDKFIKNLYEKKCSKIASAYSITESDRHALLDRIIMTPKKISIIIPIYNMEKYLSQCLDSVISQSLQEIEIICINDGSTDNSYSILQEYEWKDNRIKIIQQKNKGVSSARNIGIETAIGTFLFFLDPDDWLPDNQVLNDLYTAAVKNDVVICGGTFEEHGINGVINSWNGSASKYSFFTEEMINYSDYQFDYGWVRFIYSRNFIIYNHLRIPDLKFFEDPVFFVKAMHLAKKFYALPRCSYCYRSGHHSYELSYEKVRDLVKGIYLNLEVAKQNNYTELLSLEVSRLKCDYAWQITKYLTDTEIDSNELKALFDKINAILYDNHDRIEYQIFKTVINHADYLIWLKSSTVRRSVVFIKKNSKKIIKFLLPQEIINYLRKMKGRM